MATPAPSCPALLCVSALLLSTTLPAPLASSQTGSLNVPSVVLPEAPPRRPAASPSDGGCNAPVSIPFVYLHSGEFHHEETDLVIKGRGLDFQWRRCYRSRLGRDTAQGHGWDHSYNLKIEPDPAGVALYDGTGRRTVYRLGTGGLYSASEFFREGSFHGDGSFHLVFCDLGVWEFHALDGSPHEGCIRAIRDRNQNEMVFEYDVDGRLVQILDTLGRSIALVYRTDGRIDSIVDFKGRVVQYDYYTADDTGGSAGDLKSARSPVVTGTPHGNDFPAGKTKTYTYSSGQLRSELNHNLLSITDPLGQTWMRVEYSAAASPASLTFDRVLGLCHGAAADRIDVRYERLSAQSPGGAPTLLAVVNDRRGLVHEFRYDERGRCSSAREFTGFADPDLPTTRTGNRPGAPLRAADPAFYETIWEYNDDSLVTLVVEPNGNLTERVHELELDPGASPRARGNLRELHRSPGSHVPPGDQAMITETYEYDADFGGCCGSNFVTKFTDGCGNVTTHTYDSRGNRLRTTHPIPRIVDEYRYNAHGQRLEHIWPDNGSDHRQVDEWIYYDEPGSPQHGYLQYQIVDRDVLALTTEYAYDDCGNVVQQTDPEGNTSSMLVNALNQVVVTTSPPVQMSNGSTVQYEVFTSYDANDNTVQVDTLNLDDEGNPDPNPVLTSTFSYEILNRRTEATREVEPGVSLITRWQHDANRNVVLQLSGEAIKGNQPDAVVRYQWDERDLLYRKTRGFGGPDASTEQHDYDGNRAVVREAKGLEGTPQLRTRVFDGYGREVVTCDPMGNVWLRRWDPNSNLVALRIEGELCDVPGKAGNVRLFEAASSFDAMDRVTRSRLQHFDPATQLPIGDGSSDLSTEYTDRSEVATRTDDNGHGTSFVYDSANRIACVTDPLGNRSETEYDRNGNVVKRRSVELSDLGRPAEFHEVQIVYDAVNRPIWQVDPSGSEARMGYDSRGNLRHLVDNLLNLTENVYDGADRLLRCTRTMTDNGRGTGAIVGKIERRWAWDCNSRLVQWTDDNGYSTRTGFDALDRPVSTAFADATGQSLGRDVFGNEVSSTDANGTQISSSYDGMNRLVARTITPGPGVDADTTFEVWKYDGLGRPVSAEDDDTLVTRHHDSLGGLLRETQTGHTITYDRDGLGNAESMQYPGGKLLARTFDGLRRVKAVENDEPLAAYDYVGPHRVERRTSGDQLIRSDFVHDELNRITEIRQRSSAMLDHRRFEWDEQSNKTRAEDLRGDGPQHSWEYAYDSQYRLVRAEQSVVGGSLRNTLYQFDGVGNRAAVSDAPCAGTYFMDANSPPADAQVHQYTSTPCIGCIEYDEAGNEVLRNGTDAFARDARHRLVRHQDLGPGGDTDYRYDALGRCVEKLHDDGRATLFLYDGAEVVETRDQDDEITSFVRGHGGELVSMHRDGGEWFYFLADDLGSTRVLCDQQGDVVERYEYDDYGRPTFLDQDDQDIGSSQHGNPFLFTGHRFDPETGFYDASARHYDPATGRFLSRDPLGLWGDSLHLGNGRSYAGNNPQTFTDTTGLFTDTTDCGVVFDREDCTRGQARRIGRGLCLARRATEKADFWARTWVSFESTGYPNWLSFFVATPFYDYFSGPDRRIGGWEMLQIADAVGDTFRPFRDRLWIGVECEDQDDWFNACGANTAAYVHSSDSDIHLCTLWQRVSDARLRGAMIVHELSHMYADTDDEFYYTALNDPTRLSQYGLPNFFETGLLLNNADSYEEMTYKWFTQ